ncbi:MAG TPA: hypothetical protein VKB60_00055 [Terriglobales bacterium]|nr:hypothetical protein [Terriglobales bacterium]
MGRALEVVAGFATNPGAVFTTLTPSTGQSFTVRGTDASKAAWLLSHWAFNATAGELRILSPKLHDQVQGIRNKVTAALSTPLNNLPVNGSFAQRLYAQDNITVQLTGGAAELDTAALLIAYDDLQGAAGRFIDVPTLRKNGLNVVTDEVTVTAVTTGNFGGAVAVDSVLSRLIANTDYAIIGGMVDTRGCAVGITGIDFANLRVGFFAEPSLRTLSATWFMNLAMAYNAPYIPVFNSANKAATTIDVETNGAGGTFVVNLELVQLAPGSVGPAAVGAAVAGAAQPGA